MEGEDGAMGDDGRVIWDGNGLKWKKKRELMSSVS